MISEVQSTDQSIVCIRVSFGDVRSEVLALGLGVDTIRQDMRSTDLLISNSTVRYRRIRRSPNRDDLGW